MSIKRLFPLQRFFVVVVVFKVSLSKVLPKPSRCSVPLRVSEELLDPS